MRWSDLLADGSRSDWPCDLGALVVADLLPQIGEAVGQLDVAGGERLDQGRQLLRGEARQLDRARLRAQLADEQDADDERDGEEADLGDARGHQGASSIGTPQRSVVLPMKAGSVRSSRDSLANWRP